MKYEQIKHKIKRLRRKIIKLKIELNKKQNLISEPDTSNLVSKNITSLYDSDWIEHTSVSFSGDLEYLGYFFEIDTLTYWEYMHSE